ncbi:MAG TPA: SMP-30/gluconolactonase/LRE family protein [Streptomyces sp.]|jgi:sugar lactone lactonase YvrE|nr:SMP-30/gluconolactonase/LRE family protein [Streptomyces sp.]
MGGAPAAPTGLLRIDPDGAVRAVTGADLHFPNGMVISGSTLIVAETFGNRLSGYDIDGAGALSARRDWASFGPLPDIDDVGKARGGGVPSLWLVPAAAYPRLLVAPDP